MADAYLIPQGYPKGKAGNARLHAIKNEFGSLLGCKVVQMRHVAIGGGAGLLTRNADDPTYLFPSDHPRAGQDQYQWKDRGDGVLEGTLLGDDGAPKATPVAQAEEHLHA